MGRNTKSTMSWLMTRATSKGRVLLEPISFKAVRGSVATERAFRRESDMNWSLYWSGTLT